MTQVDINEAIYRYLERGHDGEVQYGGKPVQIVYVNQTKNKDDPPRVPRIEIDRTSGVMRKIGLSTDSVFSSNLVLTVVVSAGSLTRVTNSILKDMLSKFPVHIDIGDAIITRNPEIQVGYRDGGEYRTPVFIEYTAIIEG